MKYRYLFWVLLIPILFDFGFVSCTQCHDVVIEGTFSNCDISLENIDNSGASWVSSETDSIEKEAFGIGITVSRSESICSHLILKGFGSSAFAFSCDCITEPSVLSNDSVVRFEIISLHNFNDTIEASSAIGDLFFSSKGYQNNDYLLTALNSATHTLNEPFKETLLLMTAPTKPGYYGFKVEMEMSDGRILTDETTAWLY